jgi:hypothetical protein
MDLGRALTIILALDALVVLTLGIGTLVGGAVHGHGAHGAGAGQDYTFILVNGSRLAVGGLILLLWKLGSFSRVQEMLFGRSIEEPEEVGRFSGRVRRRGNPA